MCSVVGQKSGMESQSWIVNLSYFQPESGKNEVYVYFYLVERTADLGARIRNLWFVTE